MKDNRLEHALDSRFTRRRLLGSTGLAVIGTVFLAACGGGDDDDNGGGSGGNGDQPADLVVTIVGQSPFHFEPDMIELQSGVETTLEFRNESGLPHSFRIDGLVDTGVIKNPGSEATSSESVVRVTFTPGEPGETFFYCTAHGPQSESGTVIIT